MGWRDRPEIKTREQVLRMRVAGLLTGQTLEVLRAAVRPGVTTGELDRLAEEHIRDHGGTPSFLGYGQPPFPGSICASVNDEVVHGVPGSRVLVEGDVVSLDCGAIVDGWHGDSAITLAVGAVAPEATRLIEVTEQALWHGIAAARSGGQVRDISEAIETWVQGQSQLGGPRFGILEDFTGHGIGTAMHQAPDVPNYGHAVRTRLEPGIALAVEPMLTLGSPDWEVADDEWTICTDDGSLAAHWEHTFALTGTGIWVLTALDGGRARLAEFGAPYGGPLED